MAERRYRVLAIATHPVQYMAPVFRRMAAHPGFELEVAYCSLRGAEEGHDPEFGAVVKWDVPVLEGYSWTHEANRGDESESFWGWRNPGVAKLIREGRYDAVLCFVGYVRATFWIAWRAARAANTALLFGTDAVTLGPRDGRAWKSMVKKVMWPRLFRLADQVIVPSSGSRDLMLSLGLPEERITLTPYSVDNDWWMAQAQKADREGMRAAWGAAPGDAVVLFCAKLQPWKRPADVLQAMAQAPLSNVFLVIAGEGPLRGELEKLAESLRIASRVHFLGFVNQSQLPTIYAAADVMVLPSEYEPFAVVVNEAMCCGCPVIASDQVGAARDLVAPVRKDFVYRVRDVAALAELLKNALADRQGLAALRQECVEHMQTWSPEKNIAATYEAIARAVARKRGRKLQSTAAGASSVRTAQPSSQKLHE
jgi:glycosyltransferase involved in cell wall biosynthesis